MRIVTALYLSLTLLPACLSSSHEISKEDARRAGGKGDFGTDYCELFDWYGDDVCDDFCVKPDPDCAAEFDGFRLSQGGLCPPAVDCSSFIELHSDGTLRLDRQGEPGAAVVEATVTAEDLVNAVAVLTDPELISLLSREEPPCSIPQDIAETMTVSVGGLEHSNVVTFCDQEVLEAARRVLEDLVDQYLGSTADFVSFRMYRNGFCPPDVDCESFIELSADGTLRVDRTHEQPMVVHEATVSALDLENAIAALTDSTLIDVLSADDPPCPLPTDIHETMTLTLEHSEHHQQTMFCDQDDVAAARALMDSLADAYF